MLLNLFHLRQRPATFKALTGLQISEFEDLVRDLLPAYQQMTQQRLAQRPRQRAVGGGRSLELTPQQQFLLAVVWLRLYPAQEVLGFFFGVSDTTAGRTVTRILPLLAAAGRDTMRLPQASPETTASNPPKPRQRGRSLEAILRDVPELAVIVDSFEQPVQRPKPQRPKNAKNPKDPYYSGKKKQHTLKSQVSVQAQDGIIVDIAPSVPGPTADLHLLQSSGLLERLPPGVGAWGDLAYLGLAQLHPQGLGATPRRKPRGRERPPEDVAYNQAFARHRVCIEHTIGRLRHYQALAQRDRHHRQNHTPRVVAVAGLVNRQMRHRLPWVS